MRHADRVVSLCGLFVAILTLPALGQSIELPRAIPSFNQAYTDGPDAWGDCRLGTAGCPDRVSASGCLTTAFAAVLDYYEVKVSVTAADSCTGRARRGMDPGILNDWLRANGGYGRCASDPIGNCCLDWAKLPDGVVLTFHVNRSDVGINPVSSVVLDHALRQGRPVIAGVHWGAFCRGGSGQTEDCHWVVVTGKTGTTYSIVDPYNPDTGSRYGVRTTLDAGVRGAYIIDRFVIVGWDSELASPDAESTPSADPARAGDRPSSSLVVLLAVLAVVAGLVILVTTSGRR